MFEWCLCQIRFVRMIVTMTKVYTVDYVHMCVVMYINELQMYENCVPGVWIYGLYMIMVISLNFQCE